MRSIYLIKSAGTALLSRKVRSLLTILGIVIGITSIIMVVSTGKGAEGLIVGELGAFGSDIITLHPGSEPKGPADIADALLNDAIKIREVEAIRNKANVPDAVWIEPDVFVPGSISYEGETFKATTIGIAPYAMREMVDLALAKGEEFDQFDIRSKASVALIGDRVEKELFGENSALGKQVTIKGRKFRVVGVYEKRGKVSFFDIDELVIIPHTTAETYLTGTDYYSEVVIKVNDPANIERMISDIELTLRNMKNITNPDDDDFYVQTQQGTLETVSTILSTFTLFLSFAVAIALVVGGVGVMNIMLVSVAERTREIGLRKALGATSRDILIQFLVEAMMLTGVGGLIGIILGTALGFLATTLIGLSLGSSVSFVFPVGAALLGLGASALVGLAFGSYPAYKASKKSPIEALRYE